ncbi:MAG: hypothetical protein AMXMBFR84_30960 [Candidatus Hydrogenedentota bacterium]
MKPVTKAYLLAAGLGTRLRPLTNSIPKCMVPIHGRPLCDYWFALCEQHGITDICMNTHYMPNPVRAFVASLQRNVRVHLVHEAELLGSAGTIRANAGFVDGEDAFLVIYADNLSNVDLTRLTAFHGTHAGPLTMALFHTPYPSQCGIATLDNDGRIIEFIEKPKEPKSDLANAGLYVCDTSTLADIPNDKPIVDYGHDILPRYTGRMYGLPIDCYHLDIGNMEAYEKAQATWNA